LLNNSFGLDAGDWLNGKANQIMDIMRAWICFSGILCKVRLVPQPVQPAEKVRIFAAFGATS